MIRGYFSTEATRRRPFVDAVFHFPGIDEAFEVSALVDTGADRTILSPADALRLLLDLGVDYAALDEGHPSTGVGGRARTRVVDITFSIEEFSTPLQLIILEPPATGRIPPIPSLLGRDIISRFGLFVDQRTQQVLLLEEDEVDALNLPYSPV